MSDARDPAREDRQRRRKPGWHHEAMTSSLAGRGHSFPRPDRPGGRWQPAERRRSGDRRCLMVTVQPGRRTNGRAAAPGPTKFVLDESRIPRAWYNIVADLPVAPPPVLHPGTGQPIGPDDLAPLFPMAVIAQEVSTERDIPVPEEVLAIYRLWRPTPMHRARNLERALGLPKDVRIFYKNEGVSPV